MGSGPDPNDDEICTYIVHTPNFHVTYRMFIVSSCVCLVSSRSVDSGVRTQDCSRLGVCGNLTQVDPYTRSVCRKWEENEFVYI